MQEPLHISNISQLASRFINQTNKNIFLTGKAGTGKTTFLKEIINSTHKKVIVAAPTGIAAINAGGVTLHSLFQLPFGAFIPRHQHEVQDLIDGSFNTITTIASGNKMHISKRQLLRELELLIIDEVSMLRADLLDAIDMVLRVVRKKNNIPFGGVQCLFIGDLLQLPPVIKDQEWYVLRKFYNSVYFFDAQVLKQEQPVYLELDKIYRQDDAEFISLLNNLRNNCVTSKDLETLNRHFKPGYLIESKENIITLTTHNYKADSINKDFLDKLPGKLFIYDAEIEDEFNEFSFPVEKKLFLKEGAQVMFIKNDPSGAQRFFNGRIGKVKKLSETAIEVEFEDGRCINVEKYEWENKKYQLNKITNEIDESTVGKFIHFPIKLAWAITVHKSQGLTFDKAIIDVGDAFAPGQVYVALSRLRNLNGLILSSRVNHQSIETDVTVSQFSINSKEQGDLNNKLEEETLSYLSAYVCSCYDLTHLELSFSEHLNTYNLNENKSIKAPYRKKIAAIHQAIEESKINADKFINQIQRIIYRKETGYLSHLIKRINDAKNYFYPIFKSLDNDLLNIIEELKQKKRSKDFGKEIVSLELQVYELTKKINKTTGLADSISFGKEYTKDQSKQDIELDKRIESTTTTNTKSKSKKDKKGKKEKEPKQTGKELSFKLFKAGKSIEEISIERSYATSTIENHLAYYVSEGLLNASDFVSEEKIKNILAVQKELDVTQLTPIKNLLGDEYSYSDIRFAIASLGKIINPE